MQSIDFQNGHHLDITTMSFIQEAYTKPILAMAAAAKADSYIVSGVELTENGVIATWSNGYIVLNGEPMEFRGGTYNGNDEDSERYVVRREEILYNINANGNSVPALTRVYATLGAEESGAMSIIELSDYRIRSFVSVPSDYGLITPNCPLAESTDQARGFGAATVELATPRYQVSGNNTLSITGVFITHEWGSGDPTGTAFGTIPNWSRGSVMRIPCDLHINYTTGQPVTVKGLARVTNNGNLFLDIRYGDIFPNAITFDGTPVLIL